MDVTLNKILFTLCFADNQVVITQDDAECMDQKMREWSLEVIEVLKSARTT